MSVDDVLRMPYIVFLDWQEYFRLRPAGWRADNRAFHMLRAWGFKGEPGDVFPSLAPAARSASGWADSPFVAMLKAASPNWREDEE